jgi:hypothetical protein
MATDSSSSSTRDAALEVGGLGPESLDVHSWRMPATSSNLAAKSDSRLRST